MSRWRYLWNGLAVFLVGWHFGPRYSAASWFQPVTTIFVVLAVLGLVFVLWEDNKEIKAMTCLLHPPLPGGVPPSLSITNRTVIRDLEEF